MKTTFVGVELKRIRKSLGLTQAEMTLNGKIISIGQYSKVENGIHEIGVDTLLKILTAHDEINVQTFFINLEKTIQRFIMNFSQKYYQKN